MKNHLFKAFTMASMLLASVMFTACMNNDDETIIIELPNTGIPDDSQATMNPTVSSVTAQIPNIQTSLEEMNGILVIRVDMTGIKNSEGIDWLRLVGTGQSGQNVWVEVDGKPKGILVYNNSDDNDGRSIMTDVVFTVDNSGSMSEEANTIARDIVSWAQLLTNSRLDVLFGVVGYGGFISGAINITSVTELSDYLNAGNGTNRTKHFGGADASELTQYASSFPRTSNSVSSNECGAMAIQFADTYFSFRSGANRIYVNFTDEPNQPEGNIDYSVKFFEDQNNWPAAKGTVHTVYSEDVFTTNTWNKKEQPWLISEYTGGTTLFTSSSFSDVTLESLPVTGAMENSYIIRFTNIDELLDGNYHLVHITIISEDGTVQADKTFNVLFPKRP